VAASSEWCGLCFARFTPPVAPSVAVAPAAPISLAFAPPPVPVPYSYPDSPPVAAPPATPPMALTGGPGERMRPAPPVSAVGERELLFAPSALTGATTWRRHIWLIAVCSTLVLGVGARWALLVMASTGGPPKAPATLTGSRLLSDPAANLRTFADRQLLKEEGFTTAVLGAYGPSIDNPTFYLAAITGARTEAQRRHARELLQSPSFAGVGDATFDSRDAGPDTVLQCAVSAHDLPSYGVCFWEKGDTVGMVQAGIGGDADDAARAATEAANRI